MAQGGDSWPAKQLLVSIILGVLLSLSGQTDVQAWVHQMSHSLQEDRVGMLPPPDGR